MKIEPPASSTVSLMVMYTLTGTFEPVDTLLDRLALRYGLFPDCSTATSAIREHMQQGRLERRATCPEARTRWEYRLTREGEAWLDARWTPPQGEAA